MKFTENQLQLYSRHLILPEVGHGQEKLLNARVFMVGAGGLGSPAGYYLSAAGVGTIAIVDNDEVDLSNLQRQIAHNTGTLGIPKVESAKHTFATGCSPFSPGYRTSWSCPRYNRNASGSRGPEAYCWCRTYTERRTPHL